MCLTRLISTLLHNTIITALEVISHDPSQVGIAPVNEIPNPIAFRKTQVSIEIDTIHLPNIIHFPALDQSCLSLFILSLVW
jgi:hypothetical protein